MDNKHQDLTQLTVGGSHGGSHGDTSSVQPCVRLVEPEQIRSEQVIVNHKSQMNQHVHCNPTSTTIICTSLRPIKIIKKWHIRGFHNPSWSANLLRMAIWWNEHSLLPLQIHPLNTKCQKRGEKKKTIQISSASVYKSVATTFDSTVQQWKAIVQKIWKAGTRMRRESSYQESSSGTP